MLGLVAAISISLGISIWGVEYRPAATFYLAPTRAWGLLLGSLIALGAFPRCRVLRNLVGIRIHSTGTMSKYCQGRPHDEPKRDDGQAVAKCPIFEVSLGYQACGRRVWVKSFAHAISRDCLKGYFRNSGSG